MRTRNKVLLAAHFKLLTIESLANSESGRQSGGGYCGIVTRQGMADYKVIKPIS